MLFNALRLAFRRLSHDKGFTLINMTGLATGICACIAIYTIASYELGFDTFHPDRDRIYRQLLWLVHAATAITIFVSCMGLLGLILYIVEKRKKEIGIRKVLGAGIANIAVLLNKEFVQLIAIALVIAAPIAWLSLQRWLLGFAFRTNLPWYIFAQAGIVALAIATATISIRVLSSNSQSDRKPQVT